jgi:hypothetical protein
VDRLVLKGHSDEPIIRQLLNTPGLEIPYLGFEIAMRDSFSMDVLYARSDQRQEPKKKRRVDRGCVPKARRTSDE